MRLRVYLRAGAHGVARRGKSPARSDVRGFQASRSDPRGPPREIPYWSRPASRLRGSDARGLRGRASPFGDPAQEVSCRA